MRQVLALLVALTAVAAFASDPRVPRDITSQPRLHMRSIVGVVPVGDATDVYWMSVNEVVDPVQSILFRTRVGPDGVPQGPATVVRENINNVTVASTDSSAIVMWQTEDEVRASPLAGGVLLHPEGKFIARYVSYPRMICGAADCVVAWDSVGTTYFANLDAGANIVSGPFPLPQGTAPTRMMLTGQGLFYVRHTLQDARAALISRDGVVQYDVKITEANPLQFETTPVGMAFDGSHHVVAFVDRGKDDGELRVVRIAADGSLSEELKVLESDPRGHGISSLSLAWNGETYLLAGSYVFIGYEFLLKLDANFAPTAVQPSAIPGMAYPLRAIGRGFLYGLSSMNQAGVFVVTEDGRTTTPVMLREPGRRRAIR